MTRKRKTSTEKRYEYIQIRVYRSPLHNRILDKFSRSNNQNNATNQNLLTVLSTR